MAGQKKGRGVASDPAKDKGNNDEPYYLGKNTQSQGNGGLMSRLVAVKQDLDRLSFVVVDAGKAPPNLSARALRLWWLIACLVKLRYTGYRGPVGAVADLLRRLWGSGMSERTLYRALAEVEGAGLLRRSACKFGHNWGGVEIVFSEKCSKCLHLTNGQTLEKTKIHGVLNSVAGSCNRSKALQNEKARPVHRINPVIYSLRCVTKGRFDRAEILAVAVRDQTARSPKILNWLRLKERWEHMTIKEREFVAVNEILPALAEFLRPAAEIPGGGYVADLHGYGAEFQADPQFIDEAELFEYGAAAVAESGESVEAIRGFIASQLAALSGELAAGGGDTDTDRPALVLDDQEAAILEAAKRAAAERMRQTG
jgi:hypothetical protein